jgi:hypothetical protein
MIIKWKLLISVCVDDDFENCFKDLEADDADQALELAFKEVQKVNNSLSDNADINSALLLGFPQDGAWRKRHGDFVFIGRCRALQSKEAIKHSSVSEFWRPYGTADGTIED